MLAMLLITPLAFASVPKKNMKAHHSKVSKGKISKTAPKSNLSTDIVFDGSTVHGKYQYSDEAMATVENEKILNSLLGVRRDFRDRIEQETARK
jgi:hypothetical protein